MSSPHPFRTAGVAVLAAITFAAPAWAQPGGPGPVAGDTVSWTVTSNSDSVRRGGRLALTLRGAVRPGWHVYGLSQEPGGPTPLRVAVEPSDVARADGPPKGSAPIKRRDAAFGFDTQFYADAFTLTAPVRVAPNAAAGVRQIPLSVQFQTCNGDICQPPKTVRLLAAVTIKGGG